MQLGKFTDFGLRVLAYLGAVAPKKASVAVIAARFQLSEHHLAKICSRLVQGGFLVSERGRTGGLSLARDPRDISLGHALRCLSRGGGLVDCFNTGTCDCRLLPLCGAREPLAEAREAFFQVLDRYSLADVCHDRAGLRALLLTD